MQRPEPKRADQQRQPEFRPAQADQATERADHSAAAKGGGGRRMARDPSLPRHGRGFGPPPHFEIESGEAAERAMPGLVRQMVGSAEQRRQHLPFEPIEYVCKRRDRGGAFACRPDCVAHRRG